ncbi:hypothetical protein V5799_007483 [Amblyomma americanum]|uniref:Secreted protein n=1 Tax=Amblyomma americanum TaxID=6943 RepID=A0AAQ4FH93_AMBAM
MKSVYCFLVVFTMLSCTFAEATLPNCGRITTRSFDNTSQVDNLCKVHDLEHRNDVDSTWKLVVSAH